MGIETVPSHGLSCPFQDAPKYAHMELAVKNHSRTSMDNKVHLIQPLAARIGRAWTSLDECEIGELVGRVGIEPTTKRLRADQLLQATPSSTLWLKDLHVRRRGSLCRFEAATVPGVCQKPQHWLRRRRWQSLPQ